MTTEEKSFVVVVEVVDLVERIVVLSPLGVEVATKVEDAYNSACCRWPELDAFVVAWEDFPPKARMLALMMDRGELVDF